MQSRDDRGRESRVHAAADGPAMEVEPIVSARGLTKRYGSGEASVDALCGVSFDVERGKLTAVMGPSGSGKSTLMHILAGLDYPTEGTVSLDGQEITRMDDTALTKLRRRKIGFVFQFFNLLPMLSAAENIVLPLSLSGATTDAAVVNDLLERVGLAARRRHRPVELSGGQQQRVAIARALVTRPAIVFADEPTGNLDSRSSAEILSILRDSVDGYGQTTVMITHDAQAAAIADRVVFLADGVIVDDRTAVSPADVGKVMSGLGATR
jgi:putative ABC transport system ATP-binding protein